MKKVLIAIVVIAALGVGITIGLLINNDDTNKTNASDDNSNAIVSNSNINQDECDGLLEDKCLKQIECLALYGPSFCDENNTCTADEAYKGCRKNWQHENCLNSGGEWNKEGLSLESKCVCPEGKEINSQAICS